MERQRLQAIESLEISGNSVKCQRCGIAVPIVGKLTRTGNDRIAVLQKRIKWLENYHYPSHGHIVNNSNKDNNVKQLKQELAELLTEYANADKLRSLPLYSCRITGWKFVCSKCYDKAYYYHHHHNNNILVQRKKDKEPIRNQ
jgi:hypothetical protein